MVTRNPSLGRCALVVTVSAILGAGLAATGLAPQDAGKAAAISIDFRAIGPDGTPILDLKPEEVALKVDGRARTLTSLKLVKQTAAATAPAAPPPPPYATNVMDSTSRSTLIVIDDVTVRAGQERAMRNALDAFIAALTPTDRVGLLTIPQGGARTDVTTDHQQVRNALATVRGQAPTGQTSTEAQCQARDSLQALAGTLSGFTGGDAPINVVFFSAKMVGPTESARLGTSRDVGGTSIGSCVVETLEWQKVGHAAASARAHLYVVVPDDAAADDVKARVGLENLAGVTGAQIAHTTSGGESSLARVLRESSAYYLATFEPEPAERNGVGHLLDLKVTRSGVITRARPELLIPPGAGAAPKIAPRDMIREARSYRDLPLRSAAFVSRNPGDEKVKVMTLFEAHEAGVTLTSAMVGIYDDAGRLTAQWTSQPGDFNKLPVAAALAVPAGKYRVRVAATDSKGRAGATDTVLNAQMSEAGAVKYSSLLLADPQSGLTPKLQFGPSNPSVMTYLEIYGVADAKAVTATIELAETPDGQAVAAGPAQIGGASNMVTASGGFSIAALPPGDYVVRVVLTVNGQQVAKVGRTLRKVT